VVKKNVSVVLDGRWSYQQSGIGRFSREILGRLPWNQSIRYGQPWSALDALQAERIRLPASAVVYSPGYNAGLSWATQLLTLHDLMHLGVESSAAKRAYYDRLLKPIIRRCGRVLTVSTASATQIREWLGGDDVVIDVIGNGTSFPVPSFERLLRVSSERGLRSGPLRILYVGNMKAHKGFPVALRALGQLPDARLTVVTNDDSGLAGHLAGVDGPTRGRVAAVSNVTDAELSKLYMNADVLVMPSTEEGFGLPALEALAHALPVVYWEGCRGLDETLGPFGAAVADPLDGAQWAQALDRASVEGVKVDSELVSHLAQYAWDEVAARVQMSILEVCARRG
jgi:glycosyltransferase involved in cell wall biosynthesis